MKKLTLAATTLVVAAGYFGVNADTELKAEQKVWDATDYIACVWFPACGDPDIYSPALEPKDATRDVRSVKEEKVA
ncbi:hypothetical protein [Rheinheimera sp. NSM]|uniref:hypothetical protein n=1 Tax=Rheinheimera sp. NSM TaxID=3457884 RepID=UPI004036187B